MSIFNENTKIVLVVFDVDINDMNGYRRNNLKEYCFFTNIKDLKEGDIVAVNSMDGLTLARVIRYCDDKELKPKKWVISKVQTDLLEEVQKGEKKLKETRKRINDRLNIYKQITKRELLTHFDKELRDLIETEKFLTTGCKEPINIHNKVEQLLIKGLFVKAQ